MAKFVRKLINEDSNFSLWTSKYQPKKLSDIIGNAMVTDILTQYIKLDNIPNLIFSGPPGCGKRSMIKCLIREYYGNNAELLDQYTINISGAINRGKDAVTQPNSKKTQEHFDEQNISGFCKLHLAHRKKIVIIEDFEHMTKEAQNAMRRIIEQYCDGTRFILLVNNIDSVIEAIQSRTVVLQLSPPSHDDIVGFIKGLLIKDKSVSSDKIIKIIATISRGDVRKSINYLQCITSTDITEDREFYDLFNILPISIIEKLVTHILKGNVPKTLDIISGLLNEQYTSIELMDTIINVLTSMEIDDKVEKFLFLISQCYIQTELNPSNHYIYGLIGRMLIYVRTGKFEEF